MKSTTQKKIELIRKIISFTDEELSEMLKTAKELSEQGGDSSK